MLPYVLKGNDYRQALYFGQVDQDGIPCGYGISTVEEYGGKAGDDGSWAKWTIY